MPSLCLASPDQVVSALQQSLTGIGTVVAPLPPDNPAATIAMLQPEVPVAGEDLAAIVATSGSTGAPKGVLLSRSAIYAAVSATHDRLGGAGEWVLALPGHYVAGLMVIARSLVAGTALHQIDTDLQGLLSLPGKRKPRYLSVVPTQLVRALRSAELTAALRDCDAILLGGAAADASLLELARAAGLAVVTTYGMSETCGGCVYDGQPLSGVQVRSEAETNRLIIGGPVVFSGYHRQPDLTATALTATGEFRTSDRGQVVERDGAVYVTVSGRLDDVVITGGINVDLAAVEQTARRVAAERGARQGVDAELVVLAVPDPEWGHRLVAVSEIALTREDLAAELQGAELPREVAILRPLPRTSSGKVDRQLLLAQFTRTAAHSYRHQNLR